MKFGIFYEISVPRPWDRRSEKKVFDNCLEQVAVGRRARLRFGLVRRASLPRGVFACSAPEIFLTACAMKTKKMRVGHGIVVCVPEFNHPIKIAERTATLDIISGGRLEVGTGRSATWNELGGFRANPDETKKTWDEFVRCLPEMWTQECFGYQGRSWSMPVRAILPKPYQKPHPPMWVAVTSPGTEIDAAERGLGALGITFGSVKEQEDKVKHYRKIIANCEPVGSFVNDKISTATFSSRHEDTETGNKVGRRLLGTFNFLAAQLWRRVKPIRASRIRRSDCCRRCAARRRDPVTRRACLRVSRSAIPNAFCAPAKRWESVGVDRVNFLLNAIETVPQEQVLNSLANLRQARDAALSGFEHASRQPREVDADAALGQDGRRASSPPQPRAKSTASKRKPGRSRAPRPSISITRSTTTPSRT